jgi:hypothetical protein
MCDTGVADGGVNDMSGMLGGMLIGSGGAIGAGEVGIGSGANGAGGRAKALVGWVIGASGIAGTSAGAGALGTIVPSRTWRGCQLWQLEPPSPV